MTIAEGGILLACPSGRAPEGLSPLATDLAALRIRRQDVLVDVSQVCALREILQAAPARLLHFQEKDGDILLFPQERIALISELIQEKGAPLADGQ